MADAALFAPMPRETLSARVYRELRTAIITGRLAPGARFRDVDVAADLAISRTPVREALRRLADDGLVEAIPGSRTRVVPLDRQAVTDAFPVVAALHALAIRLAAPGLTAADRTSMRRVNADLGRAARERDVAACVSADHDFHAVVLERAANAELTRALARHGLTVARILHHHLDARWISAMRRRHNAILSSRADGRVEDAATQVEEDWTALGAAVLERLGLEGRAS
jgi:DNA-binding GntR family transcriptional regulator